MQQCVLLCVCMGTCMFSYPAQIHTQSSRGGGRVKSVYMFVSLSAFTSMAPLIGSRAAWSDDAMRQRQPMWCAILLSYRPSLIPASRPCLYVTAVMPAVSHSTGAVCVCVCVCIYARVCVHMCVVALTNLFKPRPPCLHWWWWWRWRGNEEGPLKDTPRSPLSSRLQPTAPQPSWHLPWDRLNELKEIQWDTWCSSQGAPQLLCLSILHCPQAQAQRRAHLGQSKGSKNTQYASIYQDDLSFSPNTKLPHPPSPLHSRSSLCRSFFNFSGSSYARPLPTAGIFDWQCWRNEI